MRRTLVLLAAAVALVSLAWLATHRREPVSAGEAAFLAPGLKDAVNDVKSVKLTIADGKVVATLVHGSDGWGVEEKDHYPADVAKLRELLLKLGDAKLIEEKTSLARSYPVLGVEDVTEAEAKGTLVEIEGPAQPLKVIVGNRARGSGESTYVRRAGETKSWLATGALSVDHADGAWLQREIYEIESSRVREVTFLSAAGKTLRVSKQAAGDAHFAVADVPKGRKLSGESAGDGVVNAIASMRIDDVKKEADAEPGAAKVSEVRVSTFDGLIVTAKTWEADGKHYARFVAAAGENPAPKKEGEEDPAVKVKAEAERINALCAHRTFVVPAFKATGMTKTIDDVLEAKT